MKKITILLMMSLVVLAASAQTKATPESILNDARKVNNYFMNLWPDPKKATFMKKYRPSSLWTRGVYYEGLMALQQIDPQQQYLAYTDEWSDFHKWTPRNGTKTIDADDQCCAQTYLDRYEVLKEAKMIDSVRVNLEKQMASGRVDYWFWIDAIQMAMPLYSKMYRLTGDARYMLYARDCYEWSRNTCGGGLWNKKEGLWWRDKDFVPPYKEKDGKNCYWSRGNGWVYVALQKTIQDIIDTPSAQQNAEVQAFLAELKADFLAMSKALVKCQRKDGFWNVSLVSPVTYGGKEASGTALFLSGMSWGMRTGLLPASYRKAADKAWNAIATESIHPNGFIGYLQGTGKEPKDGQPVTYTSVPDFEDYGCGCILLGAVEYYKLVK